MKKLLAVLFLAAPLYGSGIYNPGSTSGSGTGIVSPGTFTWTNPFGVNASTLSVTSDNTTAVLGVVNLGQLANVASANGVINGNFQFWQRALAFVWSGAGGYKADRWAEVTSGATPTGSLVRVSTVTHNSQYAMQMNITANTSVTAAYLRQQIENYYEFANSSVTLTAWVNSNTGTTIAIKDSLGTTSSSAHTGNSTWQQLSVTRYISTTTTSLEIQIGNQASPAISVQYFDGVMMVPGDTPINYVPRSWQQELALCQRYYEKSYAVDVPPGTSTSLNWTFTAVAIGATDLRTGTITYRVTKRIVPSVTLWTSGGTVNQWQWFSNVGGGTNRNTSVSENTIYGFNALQSAATDAFAIGQWAADSEM